MDLKNLNFTSEIIDTKVSIDSENPTLNTFLYHHLYIKINKVALSADDDKRIILADGMQTLAYGHYKCPMGF